MHTQKVSPWIQWRCHDAEKETSHVFCHIEQYVTTTHTSSGNLKKKIRSQPRHPIALSWPLTLPSPLSSLYRRSSASRPELPRVISLCSLFCFRSLPCRPVLGSIFFRFQSRVVWAAIPEDTCGSIEGGFPISAWGKMSLVACRALLFSALPGFLGHIEFCQR